MVGWLAADVIGLRAEKAISSERNEANRNLAVGSPLARSANGAGSSRPARGASGEPTQSGGSARELQVGRSRDSPEIDRSETQGNQMRGEESRRAGKDETPQQLARILNERRCCGAQHSFRQHIPNGFT